MSEISKVYGQYQESLKKAHSDYDDRMKAYAERLKSILEEYLKDHICNFSDEFRNQAQRIALRDIAIDFFGTPEIPFVAIDGTCDRRQSSGFVSLFGGAYGSRGIISLTASEGKLNYQRWELNRDVSMVAFIPIPPESTSSIVETEISGSEGPQFLNDYEVSELTSVHTKIMLLSEVFLAYDLAKSSAVDYPRLILIDNNLSGILGNTSFSPNAVRLTSGEFNGENLNKSDLHIALAHPLNFKLNVPSKKGFQPHFKIIAEADHHKSVTVQFSSASFDERNFQNGARYLERRGIGAYNHEDQQFTFHSNPSNSWQKSIRVFEHVCEKLFREKDPLGLQYNLLDGSGLAYFSVRDIVFLIGVGLRALLEICWRKKILLIGIAKDSNSRYFYRNYIGSVLVNAGQNPSSHLAIPLVDRNILEMLPYLSDEIDAPWSTLEFDSCFMTLHPEFVDGDGWTIKGYDHWRIGETTRPERIFLRSISQFLLRTDRSLSSHSIFIDRLAYPEYDDLDSDEMTIATSSFGEILPLAFLNNTRISRLHKLMMYLLSVLVRNHFPEALGYPDPLHKADWGAKSMRKQIAKLLESSEWAFRSKPLSKTFRDIRESFRR
ncbi:MAG: hypothetical protein ACFFER_04990 [Candidatus Thorarchaeota archaeon]